MIDLDTGALVDHTQRLHLNQFCQVPLNLCFGLNTLCQTVVILEYNP